MHINLDKFYSSNYRDFVHRQALEDALKLVAEIYLKDTKVDTILNITFSVDEYGENPIYLTYLDEEKKEHIVKLKPNITEALLERLKEYAKITYVDEQDEKLRQELTQVIEQSKQEAIDTANNFTISHTNEVKNDILNIINQTSDDLKEYCDNKCEMTLLAGKNYTDAKADEINQRIAEEHEYNRERYVIGTINKDGLDTGKRFTEIGVTPNQKKYAHFVNFVDARNPELELNHAGGYLLNYDGYTNLVSNLSKAGIPIYLTMQDGTPLFVSEISFLANEFTNQDFISVDLKDGVNDVRGFLINQENLEKLYSLDLSGYASKEELNSLDSKVDLVNQQVEANKEAIADNSNRIDDANQLITDNDSKTREELANINEKLDNLPQSGIDHTLTVVSEILDDEGTPVGESENDVEATKIKFAPLLKSGTTALDNTVTVESAEGNKKFNFLPNNITSDWFTIMGDAVNQFDTQISNINKKVITNSTEIENLYQIVADLTLLGDNKHYLDVSGARIKNIGTGATALPIVSEFYNAYFVKFSDTLYYISIECTSTSYTTTDKNTMLTYELTLETPYTDNGELIDFSTLNGEIIIHNGPISKTTYNVITQDNKGSETTIRMAFDNAVKQGTDISNEAVVLFKLKGFINLAN